MQQQRQINFNAIGDAFNIVSKNWQPFVIAGLLAAITMAIVYFVFYVLLFASLIAGGKGGIFMMMGMMAVMIVAMMTLAAVFQAGMFRMGFKALDGETPEVNDVFFALKNPAPYLVAGLLFGLCVGIGSIFCYIPGIILGGLLMFTIPNVIERGMAPVDAMKASLETLKSQWIMAALFYLVAMIVGQLGSIACGIGVLFTMPIAYVAIGITYRNLTTAGDMAPAAEAPAT